MNFRLGAVPVFILLENNGACTPHKVSNLASPNVTRKVHGAIAIRMAGLYSSSSSTKLPLFLNSFEKSSDR